MMPQKSKPKRTESVAVSIVLGNNDTQLHTHQHIGLVNNLLYEILCETSREVVLKLHLAPMKQLRY
jgi:hypothetical protein